MAYFAGFVCMFLVTFGAHTCRAQSETILQVEQLSNAINTIVETAEADTALYFTHLQELFDHLNASATGNIAEISSEVSNIITSIQLTIANLTADVDETDISDCTGPATSVISNANEILAASSSCINTEVATANGAVILARLQINAELTTVKSFQPLAQRCITQFDESDGEISDELQALECIRPVHMSLELFMRRFAVFINISLANDLFDGFETRVAACSDNGISGLESLSSSIDSIYEDISTCVANTIKSNL